MSCKQLRSFEECFVLRDLIVEGRETRRHFSLDRLILRRAHRRAPNAVNGCHAVERAAAAFECGDRVFEIGRRRIVGDLLDLGELFSHGGFERRFEELRSLRGRKAEYRRTVLPTWRAADCCQC